MFAILANCQTQNKCLSLSIPTPRVPTRTRTNKRSAEGGICLVKSARHARISCYMSYTKSLIQFLLAHSLNFSCPKSLIQFSVFCTYTNRLLAYQISYRLSSSSLFGQEQGIKYPAGIIVFCLVVSNLYCIRSSFSSFIHSTPTNP